MLAGADVCVGDRAGQVGAAMSSAIDWCVWPLALTSMNQQCVTLTLSGAGSRAAMLCAGQGRVWRSRRFRNSGNVKVSGLERS